MRRACTWRWTPRQQPRQFSTDKALPQDRDGRFFLRRPRIAAHLERNPPTPRTEKTTRLMGENSRTSKHSGESTAESDNIDDVSHISRRHTQPQKLPLALRLRFSEGEGYTQEETAACTAEGQETLKILLRNIDGWRGRLPSSTRPWKTHKPTLLLCKKQNSPSRTLCRRTGHCTGETR